MATEITRAVREAPQLAPRGKEACAYWSGPVGAGLRPVVRPTDRALVALCPRSNLELGDWVIAEGEPSTASIVLGVLPLRLSTLRGQSVNAEALVQGRIIAIARGSGVFIPTPRTHRICLSLCQWAYATHSSRHLQGAVAAARASANAPWTLPARRRWLSPLRPRVLRPDDAEVVTRFTTRYLQHSPEFIRDRLLGRWNAHGNAVGMFSRRGGLVGFAFLDDYEDQALEVTGLWVRSVFVRPAARGLGVAQALIALLMSQARAQGEGVVRAAIEHDNVSSLAAFARQGFHQAGLDFAAELNRRWLARGTTRLWTIVERVL